MIKISNLNKNYNNHIVLKDVNYTFRNSGITCILGPSGAGKTTLLNLLAGFDEDYTGEINIEGKNINILSKDELCDFRRENVGFIFQGYNLIKGYTVIDNILMATKLMNISEEDAKHKAKELLTSLGIAEKENEPIENLSGGQKQRVSIARALINNPRLILADEPTGALDRKCATQIMDILKEISKERLVVIITHDVKLCDYADEVLTIKNNNIDVCEGIRKEDDSFICEENKVNTVKKANFLGRIARKNFKINMFKYIIASLTIGFSVAAFITSLNFGNVVDNSINEFKEKNSVLSNGFILVNKENELDYDILKADDRIENVYYQYGLDNIKLKSGDNEILFKEKIPTAKAEQNIVYGVMPKDGKAEISLSVSVGSKIDNNIEKLIGKYIELTYLDKEEKEKSISLKISGLFSASYDDYFISSDLEQKIYDDTKISEKFSISYDVKNFEDVFLVTKDLSDQNIKSSNSADKVETFLSTFKDLEKIFLVLSSLILIMGLVIAIVLLSKLAKSRYREIGLLSALGYKNKWISIILFNENIILASVTAILSVAMMFIVNKGFGLALDSSVNVNIEQIVITLFVSFLAMITISSIVNWRLIKIQPAEALRK